MYSEIDKHQLHGMQPVLQVADVSAAVAFYRDLLGFEVDFVHCDPPVHARVSSGDRTSCSAVRIRFVPFKTTQAKPDRGYYWIHVGADLDGLCEKYRQAGVKIISEPENKPWRLRDFRIQDPDGHLHCFASEIDLPKEV